MTENIKKLIAIEYVTKEEETHIYLAGHQYVYLIDPETEKHYAPNPGWEVTGENLEERFHEVHPRAE